MKISNEYKEKYGPNTILLMQVGAFYEIYDLKSDDEDEIFSNMKDICNLCQSNYSEKKNDFNGKQVLMAGFRDYTLDKYLQKILNHDYTIVVFNQEKANKRVLDQVYSPGTFLQIDNTENISNNIMRIWIEDLPMRTGRKIVYGIRDVSKVTDMAAMLRDATTFNQPIGTKEISAGDSPTGEAYTAWNVSNVANMATRFWEAFTKFTHCTFIIVFMLIPSTFWKAPFGFVIFFMLFRFFY